MRIINDFKPETVSLLNALIAAGCTLKFVDNGGDKIKYAGDMDAFVEEVMGVDECHVYVITPNGKTRWLYLVYGNSPGELVADHICDPTLEKVVAKHYEDWDGKPQPTLVVE